MTSRRFTITLVFLLGLFGCHSDSNDSPDTVPVARQAARLRAQGEQALSQRDYGQALQFYSEAAQLEPENGSNYYKRYQVHRRRGNAGAEALQDLTMAVRLMEAQREREEESSVAEQEVDWRMQKAKLMVALGRCEEALGEYDILATVIGGPHDHQQRHQQVLQARGEAQQCSHETRLAMDDYANAHWDGAIRHLRNALAFVPSSGDAPDLLYVLAQSQYHLEDYYGVISDTGKILKSYPKHLEAYQLRGEAYWRLYEVDMAMKHFREGLKLDPEHKGCKEGHRLVKKITKLDKKGDDAFAKGQYKQAIDNWWSAMNNDMSHLAFVRPTLLKVVKAHVEMGDYDMAAFEAEKHVSNEETVEGLHALGGALMAGEKFQEAIRAYQRAMEIAAENQKRECKQKIDEAQAALKQSKEKNYYKILGVPRNAKQKEIKKSYRELALRWHPDKVIADEKEKAEKMFQDISEAYEILSDEELRAKYDRGEPVFENQGGEQRQHHMNPNMFFHQQGGGHRMHFKFG